MWQGAEGLEPLRGPLAVPKVVLRLGAARNFDRCAFSLSLNPPRAAVVLKARHAVLEDSILSLFDAVSEASGDISGDI